jgi:hypothetical protein
MCCQVALSWHFACTSISAASEEGRYVTGVDSRNPGGEADTDVGFAYDPESSAFSFDAICSQFGLSTSAIRQTIRTKKALALPVFDRAA